MGYFRDNVEQMRGYEPGFQPGRSDVVKLNTNENPYPPSPMVADVLANIDGQLLRRYPDPLGNEFREAAAEVNGVTAEQIMCCNGGDDLLRIVFSAACDESRAVAYPVPTYSLYPVLAQVRNCRATEINFDEEFNLPAKLAGAGAALTIVCNPNAPSGTFVSVEELASLADELSGLLLIDEAYVDFAEESCVSLIEEFDNVIILRSMSKGYSLAGIRFGYGMAHAGLIKELMKVKDSYNVDAVGIRVAAAAMKDHDYFRRNVEKIKDERGRLTEKLREMKFQVIDSRANFVLARSTTADAGDIYDKLVAEDIYVRYFDTPGLSDKLRITVGTREQNDRLLSAVSRIVKG